MARSVLTKKPSKRPEDAPRYSLTNFWNHLLREDSKQDMKLTLDFKKHWSTMDIIKCVFYMPNRIIQKTI